VAGTSFTVLGVTATRVNNVEARAIVLEGLAEYRDRSFGELVELVGTTAFRSEIKRGAVTYQVEIDVVWDNEPGAAVRVLGSIDDGGWRAFMPICESFIKAPDASFVDEA
jgi:hypothetical protein